MTKFIFKHCIALILVLCSFAAESRAQSADIAAREAEWQNYKLPSSDFARYTDASKVIVFRVPVEWKQQGSELVFNGANDVSLKVVIEKISEGIPLRSFVASFLQGIRKFSNDSDGITVRRTQMSGLEAREIMFEMADARGTIVQAVVWTVVEGPHAVSFMLFAPFDLVAQVEPHFKAVVQSAIIFGDMSKLDYLRASALKANKPSRIDEALMLAPALDGIDTQARAKAVSSLSRMFAESPDVVADLTEDPRPMVRAAAVEAIGLSGNLILKEFLFEALNDPDAFVAERAAKALLALKLDPTTELRNHREAGPPFEFSKTLRAASFVDAKVRAEIVAGLFKPSRLSKLPVPPPPPSRRKRTSPGFTAKVIGVPGALPSQSDLDIRQQMLAILLLRGIPAADFKMPIDDIIASQKETALFTALQVALDRRERLPVESLLKLIDSSKESVRGLAVMNLAESATPADIARIEERVQKLSAPPKSTVKSQQPLTSIAQKPASISQSKDKDAEKLLAEELRVTIKKIRLREQLATATGDARRQTIRQALEDKQIADWVWIRFARDEFETTNSVAASANQQHAKPVEIAPLGENIFPAGVTLYVALPDPASAFNKIGDALTGLQMETARSQADLTLMSSALKAQVAQVVGAPPDSSALDYLGIKMNAPVAFASWTAEAAPRGLASAARKAIVLGVSDRDRFERALTLYQKHLGSFANITEYVSTGARFIGFMPAFLSYGAYMSLKSDIASPKEPASTSFNFIGRDQCLGYPVKIINQIEIKKGYTTGDSIYLAYVGDTALLAPDWHSLRDALSRLSNNRSLLADNPDFKRALVSGGDAIYLSNLFDLFSRSSQNKEDAKLTESGALKISNQAWENSYHLSFKESTWLRPFTPFHPGTLAAPRELLPRSTLAYFFLKLDANQAMQEWASDLFGEADTKAFASVWAMDFEKEILPEIGPECGVALLGFPDTEGEQWNVPGIFFFKLKSDKLARAFVEGHLLKDVDSSARPSRIKFGSFDMLVTIKNGFLILAGSESAFARLDAKEKLDRARDFTRAAKNAPDGVIAFGGYNLEAAIAEIAAQPADAITSHMVSVFTSLARAFHSQSFYATATSGSLSAQMSVSLDREGRYSVAELSSLAKDYRPTFAIIEPRGVPIANQRMIESLKLRIRAKAAGEIERIKEDLAVENQNIEKRTEEEMILTVRPRLAQSVGKVELPISNAEFAPYLKPTRSIRSDDKSVIEKAREIAGQDRDAWSVARKLSDWTFKNLKWKRVDNADAADTLATREADCLEFSQLFVAMARALGLPARIVSGIAYSGSSFGGHAWVEVYAGRWIELDPTWGTDFVDATHVRSSSGDLLAYAMLNLVSIEVMEAPRGVADYQRDAQLLAEKICEEMNVNNQTALTAAIDMAALADEHIGSGAWSKMSEPEQERLMSAGPKFVSYLASAFEQLDAQVRLLKVNKTADRAEAILLVDGFLEETLLKFEFARKGDTWLLLDVIDMETDFHIASERLRPMFQAIVAPRDGKQKIRSGYTDLERAIMMLNNDDNEGALQVVEQLLKQEPNSRRLRHLKAVCLSRADQNEEGLKLLTQLSNEEPPMASALFTLASHYSVSEEGADKKKAIELLSRYAALEARDPRAHTMLGNLYREASEFERAEAEYRAAIERDPRSESRSIDLAALLAEVKRYDDALMTIDESARTIPTKEDLFGLLFTLMYINEQGDVAENLAAAHPERMAKSAYANFYLAQIRLGAERTSDALPLLKRAIELKKDYTEAHVAMAEAYRKLRNWTAALAAANAALGTDSKSAEAHYHMACALAQMNRKTDAIIALKRALELNEELAYGIGKEQDLKPLSRLPAFINLMPKEEGEKK